MHLLQGLTLIMTTSAFGLMAQRCIKTAGWSHIKMSESTKNGRGAWLAVSRFCYNLKSKLTRVLIIGV